MEEEEKQLLMTVVWLFMRHGRAERAIGVCEALHEADPRDGAVAAAFAELLLVGGNPRRALQILREADFPPELSHAEAVLETRALRLSGRKSEAQARWERYLESRKGAERKWIAQ